MRCLGSGRLVRFENTSLPRCGNLVDVWSDIFLILRFRNMQGRSKVVGQLLLDVALSAFFLVALQGGWGVEVLRTAVAVVRTGT